VIIETPTIKDLAGLVCESKAMFDEMGFEATGNSWEYESMVIWWETVLTSNDHDVVVARDGNRIVGVSVVFYPSRGLWHKKNTQACELAHHAAPDLPTVTKCRIMIKMLEEMEQKIAIRGPLFYKISYSPKPEFESWGKYLKKRGYGNPVCQLAKKVG